MLCAKVFVTFVFNFSAFQMYGMKKHVIKLFYCLLNLLKNLLLLVSFCRFCKKLSFFNFAVYSVKKQPGHFIIKVNTEKKGSQML